MSLALLHSSDNQFVQNSVGRWFDHRSHLCRRFFVGNTQGEMAQFDLKNLSSIVHKYRGAIGSIRSIATHPTAPLIASVSIDQYLRIHHAETHRQVSKVKPRPQLIDRCRSHDFLVIS